MPVYTQQAAGSSSKNGQSVQRAGEKMKTMQEELTPFRVLCEQTLIIPAVRKPELVTQAIGAHGKIVYLLTAGKVPIVNLDLLNGFSRDRYAVNYLKRTGARGIISTHLDPLRHAIAIGLYGIQRTFLLDSGAMDTITNQLKNSLVNALEILPAPVAPKMLDRIRAISVDLPVVGGGLIQTMKEVEDLLGQGLSAVSTSNPQMWLR
jgi:glycerol uptake operon antiterminator